MLFAAQLRITLQGSPFLQSYLMPYVNIQITKGATREQRSELVKEVTDSLVRILGKKPEHTHIVIQQIEEDHWGFCGMLTEDYKKQNP